MALPGASGPSEALASAARKEGWLPPYAVIACSVVFFWSVSVRSMVYTLMPTIAGEMRISASMAGVAISCILLGYCAGHLLAGWLPGRPKPWIMVGVLLSLPAAALVASARDYWVLLLAGGATGLALGIYLTLGLAIIVALGGDGKRARYISVHETMSTLGSFAGSAYVAVAILWTDWRTALLLWCVVGVLALGVFAVTREVGFTGARQEAAGRVAPDRTMVYSVISYATVRLLVVGLISMLPLIMVQAWGVDQARAASDIGFTRLVGLLGVAAAGLVGDRMGHGRVSVGTLALGLIGVALMALDGYGPLFLLGVMVLAAGASGAITLVPVVIAEAYAPAQRAQALGVAGSLGGVLGLVIAPALFGALLDAGLPTGPMVISVVATVAAMGATARVATRAWHRSEPMAPRSSSSRLAGDR